MVMGGIDVRLSRPPLQELDPTVAREIPEGMRGAADLNVWGQGPSWDCLVFSCPLGSPEGHRKQRTFETLVGQRPPRVYYTMFERRNVQPDIVASLNQLDGVWVPCSSNQRALERSGCKNATWIPYPYFDSDPHLVLPPPRREPKVFLWVGRWEPRKAPHNLIRAFLKAFKPGEARLILKVGPAPWATESEMLRGKRSEYLGAFAAVRLNLGGRWTMSAAAEDVEIVEGKLDVEDMLRLHARSDVYVSASRGEGLDLGVYDAKLSGRRVVTTDSGGPLDFLGEDDVVVPSTGDVPAPEYDWLWGAGATYAGYDVDALAAAMQGAMRSTREVWERARVPSCHRAEVVGGMLRTWLEERIT